MRRCDVVVVGGGAAGSATAWWLARRGVDVVLVERFEAGHTRGSSHGGTRIFRLAYPDRTYVGLAKEALTRWRELEEDAGEELLVTTGAVDHGDERELRAIAAALEAEAVPHAWLDPDEAAERHPGMHFEGPVLLQPDGGRAMADRTVRALQRRAADLGADVVLGAGPATVVAGGAGAVVRWPGGEAAGGHGGEPGSGGGEVTAPVCVLTVGAWAGPVAGPLVDLPPLVVSQEQVVHFPPRAGLDGSGTWPSFLHHDPPGRAPEGRGPHAGVVYGLLTPGEGVKVGGHHEGPATSGDDRTYALDPERTAAAVAYAERWLPGVVPDPVHGVTCLYTTTPDEHFVLDRRGPFVVGSPCSGHGFKFTPVLGRLLADLALGGDRLAAPFGLPRPGGA